MMILSLCQACLGQPWPVDCADCNGASVVYLCDGLQAQPEPEPPMDWREWIDVGGEG